MELWDEIGRKFLYIDHLLQIGKLDLLQPVRYH